MTKFIYLVLSRFLALINVDGYIYALGGKDKLGSLLTKVERYDPFLNEWKYVAALRKPVSDPAACSLNGKIYVFEHDFIQVYDPYKDEWSEIVSSPKMPRIGCAACSLNGQIYLIGGSSGIRSNCVESYDPACDEWRSCPSMLEPRYKPAAAVLNNRIYVCSRMGNAEISIEAFDLEKKEWFLVSSIVSNSYSISCTHIMSPNPLVDSSIYENIACSYHRRKMNQHEVAF
jgi:hypothetical protein